MANIAGGYVAGGIVAGADHERRAESENIANQSSQIDLDNKRDADIAYRSVMDQWVKNRQPQQALSSSAPGATPPQAVSAAPQDSSSADASTPSQGVDAGASPTPQDASAPQQAIPTQQVASDGTAQAAPAADTAALSASTAPPSSAVSADTAPQTPPPGDQSVATPPAPSAAGGDSSAPQAATPADANAPSTDVPAAQQAQDSATQPAASQKQMESAVQQVSNALGLDLSGVPRSVGGMQGLMAAQQHIEGFEKAEVKNNVNQMYRSLQGRSEAEQAAGIVQFMKQQGISGSPDGFTARTVGPDGKTPGWYALHNGDQKGQFIPDLGGGLLDSMTRVMYGAIDRSGTIGAGIEQGNKMALENQKGVNAVRTQQAKTEGLLAHEDIKSKAAMERTKATNESREKVAQTSGEYHVKAAGVSGGARVAAAGVSANGRVRSAQVLANSRNGGAGYGKADADRDARTVQSINKLSQGIFPGTPGKLTPQQASARADAQARLDSYYGRRTGGAKRSSSGGGVSTDFRHYMNPATED